MKFTVPRFNAHSDSHKQAARFEKKKTKKPCIFIYANVPQSIVLELERVGEKVDRLTSFPGKARRRNYKDMFKKKKPFHSQRARVKYKMNK